MKTWILTITLALFASQAAHAYQSGLSPYCLVDGFGNVQCTYQTPAECYRALHYAGANAFCTHNPNPGQ